MDNTTISVKPTFMSRTWLNPEKHSSTGSIVCFDGVARWENGNSGEMDKAMFIEIADCHNKVRLHQSSGDTRSEFTDKVRLLRDTLTTFLEHLETE